MTHKAHTQKGYATYKRWLLQVLDFLVGYALCVKQYTTRTCNCDNMAQSVSTCNYPYLHSLRKCVYINKLGNFYFANYPNNRFPPQLFCES
jgi:hypothetical protein